MIDHLVYQEKNAYSMSNRLHGFKEIHHIIDAIQKKEVVLTWASKYYLSFKEYFNLTFACTEVREVYINGQAMPRD